MKKERKESLIFSFPELSYKQYEDMKGKGAKNFVIFLTEGRELFARCFHRYSDGKIAERQRYVFAKDGCARYRSNNGVNWITCSEFREPVFCVSSYGYTFDNSYSVMNVDAIDRSDMRYSEHRKYKGNFIICYLQLYCKHPNLEYLMKQGYDVIDEVYTGYWGGKAKLTPSALIDWKSNDLLKMLHLSRSEFKMLKGQEFLYESYIGYREKFPKLKSEDILNLAKVFKNEHVTLHRCVEMTGLSPQRIARYLSENRIFIHDYLDYADQCRRLKYDMHDTAISMPRDFHKMHGRCSEIIRLEHKRINSQAFKDNYSGRKVLEYSSGKLFIRQPKSIQEIVDEGRILSHCVGGYAERHANGKLNIMFLRKKSDPDTPYYTVEVSTSGKIVQCRGYKNNWVPNGGKVKPQTILDFEKEYQQYLDEVFAKKNKKKERKSA